MTDCKATDATGAVTVLLSGAAGSAIVGADGHAGEIDVIAADGTRVVRVFSEKPFAVPVDGHWIAPSDPITIDGYTAQVTIGNATRAGLFCLTGTKLPAAELSGGVGKLALADAERTRAVLDASAASLTLTDASGHQRALVNGDAGQIVLGASATKTTMSLDGSAATITAGGHGVSGWLTLTDGSGHQRALVNGDAGQIALGATKTKTTMFLDGSAATITAGGHGVSGWLTLTDAKGHQRAIVNGDAGQIVLGASATKTTMFLDGSAGTITAGGHGVPGGLALLSKKATSIGDWNDFATIAFRADIATAFIGGKGAAGTISMRDDKGAETININAATGDILLTNADCAEEFNVDRDGLTPGTVMVIGPDGGLLESTHAYDKKAAGVISGAGDRRPAIRLGSRPAGTTPRKAVALTGTVYCKVDASTDAIEVGDLLTTSDVPGHAMKAAIPMRAFGAVVGKALEPLATGRGSILILVALQ